MGLTHASGGNEIHIFMILRLVAPVQSLRNFLATTIIVKETLQLFGSLVVGL